MHIDVNASTCVYWSPKGIYNDIIQTFADLYNTTAEINMYLEQLLAALLKQFPLRLCNWKMFFFATQRKHAWPWHAHFDRPPFTWRSNNYYHSYCAIKKLTIFSLHISHSCNSRPVSIPSWRLLPQRSSSSSNCSIVKRTPLCGVEKHCGEPCLLWNSIPNYSSNSSLSLFQ